MTDRIAKNLLPCIAVCILSTIFVVLIAISPAQAATEAELKAQIQDRSARIDEIEAEIARIEKDLSATTAERQTLQTNIKSLDLSQKKVGANINLTQTKIVKTDLQIDQLAGTIATTTTKIERQKAAVVSSLRSLAALEDGGLTVSIFAGDTLGDYFANAASLASLRDSLRGQIQDLTGLRTTLVSNKNDAEAKRDELADLKADLADQQKLLAQTRKEKDSLLSTTKSKEATYQALLAQKRALKAEFEADLNEFENALNLIIDPGRLPTSGAVLIWPLDKVTITQYFGNTEFATKNPQIYSGKGHNAIDLAASTGSKVKSARKGTVKGVGDTDLTCPNASYGKWVLVEHDNGLSTLYAHLSHIRVAAGDSVATGDTLGYSGNTGYSTGPHLHFSVYATQGVAISDFPSKAAACRGKVYRMPVADPKAYLNPLTYLPAR